MNITNHYFEPDKSHIKILPDHLINQIKAGEVVERPASALKELLENALDANPSEIKIHLKENGLELIQIEDDGQGMSYEELPFAFYRHATSKLKRFDELFCLDSYGFRGEALASIASSAKVSCSSQPQNPEQLAGQIELEEGRISLYQKIEKSNESGTKIGIRELFYNTPARLKFLNSKSSEKAYLQKVLEAFLLSHPEVSFSIRFDEQDKKYYKATSFTQRLHELYFKKDSEVLAEVLSQNYQGYSTELYLIPDQVLRSGKKRQFVFINKRYIVDPYFFQLCKRYLDLCGLDKNMSFVLFIESPKAETDVNVHPNKTKIKIHQLSIISSLIGSLFQKKRPMVQKQESHHTDQTYPENTPLMKSKDLSSSFHKYQQNAWGNESSYQDSAKDGVQFLFDQTHQKLINFKLFLKHHLLHHYSQNEIVLLPLLISEKIKMHEQNLVQLKICKDLGFEIDIVDDIALLKTIPQFFEDFTTASIARFIEDILLPATTKQSQDLRAYLSFLTESSIPLVPALYDYHFKMIQNTELDPALFTRKLTQDDWLKLWQT